MNKYERDYRVGMVYPLTTGIVSPAYYVLATVVEMILQNTSTPYFKPDRFTAAW